MGKKNWGANAKATQAKEKKEDRRQAQIKKAVQEQEDREWEETDRRALKKMAKQKIEEDKRIELDSKRVDKIEAQKKEDEDIAQIKIPQKPKKEKKAKDMASLKFMKSIMKSYGKKEEPERRLEDDIEEKLQKEEKREEEREEGDMWDDLNPNHKYWGLDSDDEDGHPKEEIKSATGIDDALKLLSGGDQDKVERHPEKRMKQAWRNYVDERLPDLRKQFPHFKRGKLLYMLRQEWQKAPQNPMNKEHMKYNEKLG